MCMFRTAAGAAMAAVLAFGLPAAPALAGAGAYLAGRQAIYEQRFRDRRALLRPGPRHRPRQSRADGEHRPVAAGARPAGPGVAGRRIHGGTGPQRAGRAHGGGRQPHRQGRFRDAAGPRSHDPRDRAAGGRACRRLGAYGRRLGGAGARAVRQGGAGGGAARFRALPQGDGAGLGGRFRGCRGDLFRRRPPGCRSSRAAPPSPGSRSCRSWNATTMRWRC